MHHIQSLEPPGRFLSKNYSRCEWEVVTDAVAREKVCQAFRDAVAIERDKEQTIKSSAKRCWTHCVTPQSATTCDDATHFLYQSNIFDDNGMKPIVTPIKQEMVVDNGIVSTDQYFQSDHFEGTNPIVSPIKQEMIDEFDEDPNLCHHQSVNFQNVIPVIHYPPIKQEMVNDDYDDEEESYHQYHCNVYDDFDLFDGELLRNIEVDEVLSNAAV